MIRSSAGPQLLSLLPKINFENISSKNKLMAALKLVFHYQTVSQPWSGGAGLGAGAGVSVSLIAADDEGGERS